MLNNTKCWVPTCLNPNLDLKKKVFPLPKDAEIREVWLALSGKPTETICTKEIIFCQDHFSTQDIVRIDEKQYQNKHKIVPINYMPDRMCGTCMSLIPPEHSFHIVSSKFPSEMPPVVKEILNFMVPSKPEPLHQIFTFCMKELKLPRDPPPVVCNDCYTNAWVYFVFKMTCIEVEKDLKADMSWENYGKKVLCRSCPQTMGTNFITLLSSPSMASLLQNMFIGHCPPPEIVPLQVCITCYNVLQRIDRFYKNCLEAGEKMERHLALQKKYYRISDGNIPSSSTVFTKSGPNTRVSGIPLQSGRGSVEKVTNKMKVQNVGSSRSNKVLLAQLMLEHGQMLKTDLYQEDVWSIICEKMQQKGVGCNVPGLMNVWREMVHETNTKFDTKQPISLCDKLIMEFYKTTQNFHLSKSNLKPPSTLSATERPNISSLSENKEKKSMSESESESEKQIPVLEDESRPISKSKTNKKTPIDLPNKISAWTDDNKSDFLDIFEKEYIQYAAKIEDMGKRRPWKTICTNIATGGYYNIKDDTFFHRLWMNMKSKAEEDSKSKPSPLSKKVLLFLKRDTMIYSGKPLPFTNEEKVHLIKLFDKHMHLNQGKWPPQQEYWEAVAKDFAAVNPLHNAESVKRGHRNLRGRLRTRIEGPLNEIDKLMVKHLENIPGVLEGYGYKVEQHAIEKKKDGKVATATSGTNKSDSKQQSSGSQSNTAETTKDMVTKQPAKTVRSTTVDKTKLVTDMISMFDSLSKQQIIELDKSIWTTLTRKIIEKGEIVGSFSSVYGMWRGIRMKAMNDKNESNQMFVRVRSLMKKHVEIMKGALKKTNPVADATSEQQTTPKQPEKADRRSVARSPVMTFEEKQQFVDDFIREYKALVKQDPSIVCRSKTPWKAVAQRVADKTPGMSFHRAYSLWGRFKMSAKSHERDGSDPIDVLVWDLMERHQEMVKNLKTKVADNEEGTVVEASVPETVDSSSKKRPSDQIQPVENKKKKYAVMDESAFNKLQPQQHDEILSLLSTTHEQMLKSNEQPDLRWKHVIDKIYKSGGYRDITYKDFVYLFNRMRSEFSTHKAAGELTPFDRKLDGMLRKAAADKQSRGSKKTGKYEKDCAYRPGGKVAPAVEGGKVDEIEAGVAEVSRKRRSTNHAMFNLEEFYESDGSEQIASPPKKQSITVWSKAEKLALISTVKKRGSAVFQNLKGSKFWAELADEMRSLGYQRSAVAIRWYWNHLRRNAEMAWASQTESTDIDKVLIEFMTSAIKEKKEPAESKGGSVSSDSDSRDKMADADEGVVDLTYDYVSFDDIERLSMEAAGEKLRNIKSENKEGHHNVIDIKNGINENAEEHSGVNFVMTKVEGGIEYDNDEEMENSQPEYVSAEEIGLSADGLVKVQETSEHDDNSNPLSHIEYMYLDAKTVDGQEEDVFQENESGPVEATPCTD